MNIIKKAAGLALSLITLTAFDACSDYEPFTAADLFERQYTNNFFQKYGQFPADQSWDFSDAPRTSATDPSVFDLGWNGGSVTRAITPGNVTVNNLKGDNWYAVDKTTQEWALEHLVEGRNNTLEGHPFSLIFPNEGTNKFAIIPIFKGQACITWQLCLSDGEHEVVLWEPWPINTNEEKDKDGYLTPANDYTSDIQYQNSYGWQDTHYKHNLASDDLKDFPLRSHPIIVSGVTGEFYLYLKTTYIQNNKTDADGNTPGLEYGEIGDIQSSIGGCISSFTCSAPANINDYKTMLGMDQDITNVMVIGCEDHQHGTVDWDMNDIVFLFVGLPDLPTKREVTKSKRYLIEDLGTTVDFDFNDVVVDVTETALIDIENNTEVIYTQEAIIKHLCGTVPFTVYFVDNDGDHNYSTAFKYGNLIDGEVQDVNEECKDANGNYKYTLTYSKHPNGIATQVTENPFWDYARNNIRIDVSSANIPGYGTLTGTAWGEVGQMKTIHFEKPGKTNAPYIIAVPTTQPWTKESEDFPINDFTLLP